MPTEKLSPSAKQDQAAERITSLQERTNKRSYQRSDHETLQELVDHHASQQPHVTGTYQLTRDGGARITYTVKPEFAPPEPPQDTPE